MNTMIQSKKVSNNENILFINTNILDSNIEAQVNPVNCVGVMGKGLALQYKNRYPRMFEIYKNICTNPTDIQLTHGGDIWVYHPLYGPCEHIINVATKEDWRNPSKYEWVEKGIWNIYTYCFHNNIDNVAMPLIGCGNGGIDSDTVIRSITMIYSYFEASYRFTTKVYVCDYKV